MATASVFQDANSDFASALHIVGCNTQCVCPDGSSPVNCLIDPCASKTCPTGQQCVSDYCGGELQDCRVVKDARSASCKQNLRAYPCASKCTMYLCACWYTARQWPAATSVLILQDMETSFRSCACSASIATATAAGLLGTVAHGVSTIHVLLPACRMQCEVCGSTQHWQGQLNCSYS
jgi:hypothetical protein